MARYILFSKNPLQAKKNLEKIPISKFLLNVLVEFPKVLANFKFHWNSKIISIWKSFPRIWPSSPASAHSFPVGRCHLPSAHSAWMPLAPCRIMLPPLGYAFHPWCSLSLSPVSLPWGPHLPVSFSSIPPHYRCRPRCCLYLPTLATLAAPLATSRCRLHALTLPRFKPPS
jgi:hypothetical protein